MRYVNKYWDSCQPIGDNVTAKTGVRACYVLKIHPELIENFSLSLSFFYLRECYQKSFYSGIIATDTDLKAGVRLRSSTFFPIKTFASG